MCSSTGDRTQTSYFWHQTNGYRTLNTVRPITIKEYVPQIAVKRGVIVKMIVSDHATRIGLMKKHLEYLSTYLNRQKLKPAFEVRLLDVSYRKNLNS